MVSLVMTSSKKLCSVLKASDQTNQVYHGSSCLFYHLHIVCMCMHALYTRHAVISLLLQTLIV